MMSLEDARKLTIDQRCYLRRRGVDVPKFHRGWHQTALEKFEGLYEPEPNSGCFLWLNALNEDGYGAFKYRGQWRRAHRAAWELYRGPIPDDLEVCHKCDVPSCVNPGHLFLGTHQDNIADCVKKGRVPRGEDRPRAKLTEAQVLAIRADPRKPAPIAAKYGITPTHVYMIKHRLTWRHL